MSFSGPFYESYILEKQIMISDNYIVFFCLLSIRDATVNNGVINNIYASVSGPLDDDYIQ